MVNDEVTKLSPESNGQFTISKDKDGLFLTVYPANGGKSVLEPDVINALKEQNIVNFNYPLLVKAVKEAAGQPVRIFSPEEEKKEADIQTFVERDRMEAFVSIKAAPDSQPPTPKDIVAKLEAAGVKYGIDQERIQRACQYMGAKMSVAVGKRPIDGKDAYISYLIDIESKGKPTELENGSVDYKSINSFIKISEGEVIAEKFPSMPGTAGLDVLGNTVPPKPGRDIPLPLGKNVKAVDNKLIAAISGQVVLANNKVSVIPTVEVNGDIDFSSGNIDFVGSVIIKGSVQPGFYVKAEGDIEILGSVCGGIVEGNNVTIRMGIQGMLRGHVKARSNIYAKFIENSNVSADLDVIVTDVILHSHISAKHKVIVEGKRGLIAGGKVTAGEEIRAKSAGTQLAVVTELEVGVNPLLREEYQNLKKELRKVEATHDQTQKSLALFRSLDQNQLPPEKRELMLKLTKAQFQLAGHLETMHTRLCEIEKELDEIRNGRIRISDIVYPGVKIVVGNQVKPVREQIRFVTFYVDEGELKTSSYN